MECLLWHLDGSCLNTSHWLCLAISRRPTIMSEGAKALGRVVLEQEEGGDKELASRRGEPFWPPLLPPSLFIIHEIEPPGMAGEGQSGVVHRR